MQTIILSNGKPYHEERIVVRHRSDGSWYVYHNGISMFGPYATKLAAKTESLQYRRSHQNSLKGI